MATIKEVAKLAGVSTSTVSRALSGSIPVEKETKRKVLAAVAALHYEPNVLAKGLKKGKTDTVALIIPDIGNRFFPPLIKGIETAARLNGYTVILCNTDNDGAIEKKYLDKMEKRLIDGVIVASATQESTPYLLELKQRGIPVVLVVRHIDAPLDAVILDNRKGAYDAVTYLLHSHRRRIAIINGNVSLSLYAERLQGYKQALWDQGMAVQEELMLQDSSPEADGYACMQALLKTGPVPDAVFATTDLRGIGAMRAIADAGLSIPKDVAVIGFDDLGFSKLLTPSLTTISQPLRRMGEKAMNRLIALMDAAVPLEPQVDVILPSLIVRESTG